MFDIPTYLEWVDKIYYLAYLGTLGIDLTNTVIV